MSETPNPAARRGPFDGHAPAAVPDATGQVGVRLSGETLGSVTQVSTWVSGVPALEQALAAWLGHAPPARTGLAQPTSEGLLVRTGPEEFLLVGDKVAEATALLRRQVAADVGAVTDLSHARCRIRVEGPRCCDALSKLFPIDLRSAAFPVGEVRLTGHHHVPAMLHRTGVEQFDLLVFTTYAQDQLQVLVDAALEYGVAVEA